MQPFGQQPGGYAQQPPGPGGAPPMTSPFGAPGAPGAPGGVRASPFGAPGAAPPTSAFGAPPGGGGMAPPPAMGGGPPTSAFGAPPTAAFGAPPGGPPMGGPPMGGPPMGGPPMGGPPMGGPPMGGPPMGGPPMGDATGMSAPPAGGNRPGLYAPAADAASMGMGGGGMQQPGMPGMQGPANDAHSAAIQKEIDLFNSPAHFVRGSVSKMPNSVSSKQKTQVPLGIVVQPLAPYPEEPITEVSHSALGTIVRCKQCRTYINPFIQWESNGRRWTCNLCGSSQLTPDNYVVGLDECGKRQDRYQRPELCKGAVEYIAPGEYMVRPPQPPVFMFVIDVSYTAVVTGMLDTVVNSIKDCIQSGQIPGGQRVQMGIITFDTSLHFYNLNPNLSQPQMLVVSDLEDLFLPLPDDILVPITESEAAIMNLLDQLPAMFRETKINESCMGSAVKGAFMSMKHIGGKLLVFGACIPSVGELSLKSTRDNPRLLGTDKEVELLRPVSEGYKELATELTRAQISVEMFLGPQQYIDLASIAPLAKFTGGDVRYYPQFHINTTGLKLKNELTHVLTRYMGWEAVMRIRVSRGWKITKFYGHLFVRGADLLVVPNCHADQTFAIAIDMEENVSPDPVLYVQSALLYTNCDAERRIRVHTWAALATSNYQDIMASVDVQATTAMLSQIYLEHSLKSTLTEGRNRLNNVASQIVQASNMCPATDQFSSLQFLPLYIIGMMKSMAFRNTNDIPADMRTFIIMRLESLTVPQMAAFYYPRMMGLHSLADSCGMPDENGAVTLPDMLNLTSESMTQDGVYLIENGHEMDMWIGASVDPNFLQSVFGVGSVDQFDPTQAEAVVGTLQNPVSEKVANILREVRAQRPVPFMHLNVYLQKDPRECRFFASLIEDRTAGLQTTYTEFLNRCGYRPQAQAAAGNAMAGPPMGGAGMGPPR